MGGRMFWLLKCSLRAPEIWHQHGWIGIRRPAIRTWAFTDHSVSYGVVRWRCARLKFGLTPIRFKSPVNFGTMGRQHKPELFLPVLRSIQPVLARARIWLRANIST